MTDDETSRSLTSGGGDALDRRELWLVVAFWTFFGAVSAANRMFDPRAGTTTFSTQAVTLAFLESYLWALATPAIFRLVGVRDLGGGRVGRVLLLLLVGAALAMFVDVTVELVRAHVFPFAGPPRRGPEFGGGRRRGPPPEVLIRLRFLNDFMVSVAILAAGLARDYFLRYRARQEEAVRLTAQAAQLQAQLAEARLAVLRTQLNPHFLFNTLHAVSALVERDPRGVRRMIARLSELLRFTLDGSSAQEVTLRQELELLARYLEIMQIRFQGRLETSVDAAPDAQEALVPTMILQPLVENAMKHGVDRTQGTGRIVVRAERMRADLVLTVRDNGPGPDAAAAGTSTGLGLRNTRERLEQMYGAQARFTLRAAPEGGTVAEIVLPYHTATDLRAAVAATGD